VPRCGQIAFAWGRSADFAQTPARSADERGIWARFSRPKERTLWYYRSLADRFCERLDGQLSNELREIVEVLEAEG
jgi:hypothetical protein